VVERPSSVVKELVENAFDAAATTVTIRLVDGGLERVEVADDGQGIPPGELELAVERHATSKLPPEGPVERIDSLGFRGEALAAIATVSRLRLVSRPAEREVAEGISAVGGALAGRFVVARAPGTTVEVEDLFFNTPARRKFLKSPAAEQLEVVRQVERMYLAHPSVTIRLESEGKEVAVYPSTQDLTDAVARVVGGEILRHAFSLSGEVPGGRVFGVLGRPPLASSSANQLYFAVNGRAVGSRALQQAVRVAFGDYLPRGRYPVGVLHLELGPEHLDVNVHPTKREVRIARERDVAEVIRQRVREALVAAPHVADLTAARAPLRGASGAPVPSIDRDVTSLPREFPEVSEASAARQRRLDEAQSATASEVSGVRARPRLVLWGSLDRLYWVGRTEEGLVLVDQHAASERLLYESLLRDRSLARQTLVEPVTLRLSAARRAALEAHASEVGRTGFDVEPFGPETYRIRAVPSFRGRHARAEALGELLDELAEGGRPTVPDGLVERTAATLACHAAIRAGDEISLEEITRVLDELAALPEAAPSCPHGRPILLGVPRSRLDRWFLRSGT
jgi:DNA mismatch repair protein MutL